MALLLKMQDLRLVSGEKTQFPAARFWWDRAYPHPLLIRGRSASGFLRKFEPAKEGAGSDRLQLFLETKRYSYL